MSQAQWLLAGVAFVGLVAVSEAAAPPSVKARYSGTYRLSSGGRGTTTVNMSGQNGTRISGRHTVDNFSTTVPFTGTISSSGKIAWTGRSGPYGEKVTAQYTARTKTIAGSFTITSGRSTLFRGTFTVHR